MTDHERLARALEAGLADDLAGPAEAGAADAASAAKALGPSVVLAWLMIDAAAEATPGFDAALAQPGTVLLIEAPDKEWGEEVATAWRLMTTSAEATPNVVYARLRQALQGQMAPQGQAPIGHMMSAVELFAFDERARLRGPDLATEFGTALRRGRQVHAITVEAAQILPTAVVASADARLVVARPDSSMLLAMVRRMFGGYEGDLAPPADEIVAALRPADLGFAWRRHQSPTDFLEKLTKLVLARQRPKGPGLEMLPGLGAAETWGRRMAADLRAYAEKRLPWSEIERGVVLVGPPGCGKTTFAAALAVSADVSFVAASLQDWQGAREGHLGTTLAAMRASFDEARRLAPCVLLVDELDSFVSRSTVRNAHREYHVQVVNAFLEQLDGARGREGVLVIGCTNDAENIDPAILRSERLERVIEVPLPDREALAVILRQYLGDTLEDADLRHVAEAAHRRHATGADIAAWCRAARATARGSGRPLTLDDLVAEVGEPPPPLDEEARRRVAIHEAGHTIAYLACGPGVFEGVSLVDGRDGRGVTLANLEKLVGPASVTRRLVRRHLRALLAGRAAEIELLGDVSSGAGGSAKSDLARATRLAVQAVGDWCLDEHESAVVWRGAEATRDPTQLLAADGEIRERVAAVLGECMADARRLVRRLRGAVEEIADALLEHGRLGVSEAAEILDRHFPRQRQEPPNGDV